MLDAGEPLSMMDRGFLYLIVMVAQPASFLTMSICLGSACIHVSVRARVESSGDSWNVVQEVPASISDTFLV